jgi:thiol-disulfide isomerase/thioredoxin
MHSAFRFLPVWMVGLVLLVSCRPPEPLPPAGIPKTPLPEFRVRTLEGEEVSSLSLRGRWVVVNFWATWCPPCVREIPDFIALQSEFGSGQVQFLGLSVDDEEDVVRQFAARVSLNYPVAVVDEELVGFFGGVDGLPTTFVVDPDGQMVNRHTGLITREELRRELQARMRLYEAEKKAASAQPTGN